MCETWRARNWFYDKFLRWFEYRWKPTDHSPPLVPNWRRSRKITFHFLKKYKLLTWTPSGSNVTPSGLTCGLPLSYSFTFFMIVSSLIGKTLLTFLNNYFNLFMTQSEIGKGSLTAENKFQNKSIHSKLTAPSIIY